MKEINSLASQPEFYNTLTTNCTGNIWLHSKVNPGSVPYSWKILLSGYVPEYLYEQGKLDTSLPFPELQQRSRVNAAAQAADQAPIFRGGSARDCRSSQSCERSSSASRSLMRRPNFRWRHLCSTMRRDC